MVARGGFAVALLVALATPAGGAEIELKNDGFVDGGAAGFQGGFVAGEIPAVRLTPPGAGPYQVNKIRFLFGGAAGTHDVTLRIYQGGTGVTPGAQIFSSDYSVTAADDAFQEIDLTADSVYVSGAFRVGLELTHSGFPGIARDDDGVGSGRNFLYACLDPPGCSTWQWIDSSSVLPGDIIIRAIVDDGSAPGTPDAAPPGTPDAAPPGTPDAGGGECVSNGDCAVGEYCNEFGACSFDCREDTDCGDDMACNSLGMCVAAEGDGGGCGCSTGGRDGTGAVVLLLGFALLAVRRRR